MRFLVLFTPAAQGGAPDPAARQTMADYSTQMMKAGLLVSQGMLSPEGDEIQRADGQFSVRDKPAPLGGYAFVNADSRAAAVEGVKQFLSVAGDGVTVIRQVLEQP